MQEVIYYNNTLLYDDKIVKLDEKEILELKEKNIINGDIIFEDFILKQHYSFTIYGILQLSSNVVYDGKKKFISILDKFHLDIFSSSKKNINQDYYVGVKIKEVKKNKIIAELLNYVGQVGNLEVEKQVIINTAQSMWKNKYKLKEIIDLTPVRIDLTQLDIFSIDPIGCLDIDDAMSIEILDNSINISIHIADVSSFILHNSDLDIELSNRCESIYLDNFQKNMLDDNLVEHCSLFQNKLKRAFSILLEIDLINNTIKNITFTKSNIIVKNNFHYEEDNIYTRNTILVSNVINNIKKYMNKEIIDTHDGIAIFMILANNLVAEYLYNNINNKALVRKTTNYFNLKDIEKLDLPIDVINKAKIYYYDKAEYCFADENTLHHNLGSIKYTHFTSPIRRYADILVHRQLYNTINNVEQNKISYKTIFNLNKCHSKYKKCELLMQEIIKIDNIRNNYGDIFTIDGYIVNYDEENNINIYIQELNLIVNNKLYPDKFDNIISKKIIDKEIILSYNDNTISYKLYDKVTVKISITFNNIKKINSCIINPDFNLLFN